MTSQKKHGQGEGSDYRSSIKARNFNSQGTTVLTRDHKTGRSVELMSHGERMVYDMLYYRKDIEGIQEQFELDLETTNHLATLFGIEPPRKGRKPMTTDLVAYCDDGHIEAYSVKYSRKKFECRKRNLELAYLEKKYWELQGVPFTIVFKEDLNKIFTDNLRETRIFADPADVFDEASCLKHMIWHRLVDADIENKEIRIPELMKRYGNQVRRYWKQMQEKR